MSLSREERCFLIASEEIAVSKMQKKVKGVK